MSEGKVALVTGASRGIGRAIAARLAREGYAVGVNYHERKDKAEELVAELTAAGCRALAVRADVAVRAEVEAMAARVELRAHRVRLYIRRKASVRRFIY